MKALRLMLLLVLAAACGDGQPEYFPLNADWLWEYRVVLTTKEGSREQRHLLRNLPAESWPEGKVVPRQSGDGGRQHYLLTAGGIDHLRQSFAGGQRSVVTERVLGLPWQPGASWQANTTTVALVRFGPPQRTYIFRVTQQVPMTYRIETIDDQVTVPAGNFNRCLRVYGRGKINADVGNFVGRTTLTVESWDWYAPGVGLVKSKRRETTTSAVLRFGELIMELQSLQR
jgi:hypothetical protein